RKAKEEDERKAKEEAERKAKEEGERKAKEEAERKAKEEAERKAKAARLQEAMREAARSSAGISGGTAAENRAGGGGDDGYAARARSCIRAAVTFNTPPRSGIAYPTFQYTAMLDRATVKTYYVI